MSEEVAWQNTSTSIMVRRVSLVPLYLAPGEESLGIMTGCGSPHEVGLRVSWMPQTRFERNRTAGSHHGLLSSVLSSF